MFVFTKYSKLGASSRVRFFKYIELDYLSEPIEGINSLFNDGYIRALYSNRNVTIPALHGYLVRFLSLIKVLFNREIKLIWIEKELFPYIPIPFEVLFHFFGKKVIYDFDDAVFHNYDNKPLSFLYALKFKVLMSFSDLVFVGNKYLLSAVKSMGANNIAVIPTVVDFDSYLLKKNNLETGLNIASKKNVIIGWIGTPSTQKYLCIVDNAISRLQNELNFEVDLYLIGVSETLELKSKFIPVKWSEKTEVDSLLNIDIGIMPLYDSKFEKGKCGYKIIQYFACGKPVIASPIGVNDELIIAGENGFLCNDESEWYD